MRRVPTAFPLRGLPPLRGRGLVLLIVALAGTPPRRSEAARGETATSADPFASCESQLARSPERWESARCFYDVSRRERRWAEAARRLAAHARQPAKSPWLGLARAYVERERDPRNAPGWYRQAIVDFVAARHLDGEVRARCAFADWLAMQEGPEATAAARDQLRQAVRSAEAAGASGALAEALIFQARQTMSVGGSLPEAYRLGLRAEALLFPRGDPVRQMLDLELLARLERELGLARRSESRYRRLEAMASAQSRASLVAISQAALGMLWLEELDRAPRPSGRPRVALQLQRALASAQALGDPQLEASMRTGLSLVLEPGAARQHLEACLAQTQGRNERLASACLVGLARLQAEVDPRAAERALAEAAAAAVRSADPAALARLDYGRMNLRWRLGPRKAALAETEAALRSVETLRDRQLEQMGRAGLFSRWISPYYAASGHLLDAYRASGDRRDLERGFAITESLRARVLRDLLATRRDAGPAISLSALEQTLEPEEAILSYQVAPRRDLYGYAGGSWVLVVHRAGTRAYLLPPAADRAPLESAASALLGAIEHRATTGGAEAEISAALGTALLAPALADLPPAVRRLVILPDGVLHLLPFAALRLAPGEPPLAERYEISLASSATLWERWRHPSRQPTRAALVLADPALATLRPAASPRRAEAQSPLAGARREGRFVARRLGDGSRLRIGPEAGEGFLKRQDLSRFGLLHFATHAESDEANPESSAVLLSRDAPGEDGRLQVDEIARLDLNGSLVALSSCRSASGALVAGEGVMSLSRAFFAAGASVVLGTLWPVRDDDAEAFFALFYDRLGAGASAAQAFGAAQSERLRQGAPTEAWAGFVLSGDGDWRLPAPTVGETERHSGTLRLWVSIGLATLLAVKLALWARRTRRPPTPNPPSALR